MTKAYTLPIRNTEAEIAAAAHAVAEFLGQLQARGLVITVFGVPITIALGSKP
jgi:hypothetical protein